MDEYVCIMSILHVCVCIIVYVYVCVCVYLYVSVCVCGKTSSIKCAYQHVLQLIRGVNSCSHALVEHVDPTPSPMQADLGGLGLDLE